jgi:hypothetical protein
MSRYAAILVAVAIGLLSLGAVLGAGASRAAAAPAAGVVGNGDPASCTEAALRSSLSGGGSVTFNCGAAPVTITVLSVLTVTQPTTVSGNGLITLWGVWETRLFFVEAGASLTLDGMVLSHGDSGASDGGAIRNHGTLNIYNSAIRRSFTADSHSGGAIFSSGPLTIVNSQILSNTAGSAGAIFVNGEQARVRIVDTRVSHNYASNVAIGRGGAIWVGSLAHLSLEGGELYQNQARNGGGIYISPGAVVTLTAGAYNAGPGITTNKANQDGGGIYNQQGTLTIDRSGIVYNTVVTHTPNIGYGGGIASFDGSLAISDTMVHYNSARIGGGVYFSSSLTTTRASIHASPVTVNRAHLMGGGIYAHGAPMTPISVTDSTFDENTAGTYGGGLGLFNMLATVERSSFLANVADEGGGLYHGSTAASPFYHGLLYLRDSTLTGNTASTNFGGGISTYGHLVMNNTTLISNTNGLFIATGGDNPFVGNTVLHNVPYLNCDGGGGTPLTRSGNFSSDTSCSFTDMFDTQGDGLDPLLGPLSRADTSETWYHPPLPGSPLIDKGHSVMGCSPRDQIGAARNGPCDIGAVEHGGLLPQLFLPFIRR